MRMVMCRWVFVWTLGFQIQLFSDKWRIEKKQNFISENQPNLKLVANEEVEDAINCECLHASSRKNQAHSKAAWPFKN